MQDSLTQELLNIDKYNLYDIVEVFKESMQVIVDKDGKQYTRKIIPDTNISLQDIESLQSLHHQSLCKTLDVYKIGSKIHIIQEYIYGVSLKRFIIENQDMTHHTRFKIMNQLVDVLAYLHKNNIIHRDIKPDNIIITKELDVYLIDLQSYRVYDDMKSEDTIYIGTIGYAAPEQFGYGQTDQRTDIYGLGATFYHLLELCPPTRGNISSQDPYFGSIVAKACSFDPNRRHSSVEMFFRDLEGAYATFKMNAFIESLSTSITKALHLDPLSTRKTLKIVLALLIATVILSSSYFFTLDFKVALLTFTVRIIQTAVLLIIPIVLMGFKSKRANIHSVIFIRLSLWLFSVYVMLLVFKGFNAVLPEISFFGDLL